MAENKEVKKSKREETIARLQGKHPDKQYADDDALFGQINDDYDDYGKQLEEYQGREKELSNLFTSDPRSANFLTRWAKGENPVLQLVKTYGEDFLEWMKDEKHQDEMRKATQDYADRVAQEEQYEEQYSENMDKSRVTVEELKSEEGLSDEEINAAINFLMQIYRDVLLGRFTKESIQMALKAINHDSDVETADSEGEVRGRNANIKEQLRKRQRSDGQPTLDGKNGGANGVAREGPELGALSDMGNSTIWERGGEKRKQYRY